MSRRRDLTGQRFGKLIAVEPVFDRPDVDRGKKDMVWKFLCDCGNTRIAIGNEVTRGHIKSCGCLSRGLKENSRVDLIGKTFGRLTALECVGRSGKVPLWKCSCSCGNTTVVRKFDLVYGRTRSCGCFQKTCHILDEGEANFKRLYRVYKKNAEYRNFVFELTPDEFRILTSGDCYYCGSPPSNIDEGTQYVNGHYIYNGVDRVDNSIGYVISNCVSCCTRCNRAKNDMSITEFLDWVSRIHNNYSDIVKKLQEAINCKFVG